MHELSICQSIIGIAERHAAGRPVAAVHVDVGHLRQVVPDTLEYCWSVAVTDTALAGARLVVNHIPAVIDCRACGSSTELAHPVFRCGSCAGTDVELRAGEELLIRSLDIQGV